MLQSMTAFAQVQSQCDNFILTWEMRSLNHRYLDLYFRLPEVFRHLEASFRQNLRGQLSRGKFEFQLKLTETQVESAAIEINEPLVKNLLEAAKKLATKYQLGDDIGLQHVLSWPGVMTTKIVNSQLLSSQVEGLFQKGIDQLLTGRRSEGAVLEQQILLRLHKLRQEVAVTKDNAENMVLAFRNKLMSRLQALEMTVTDVRIEQELALLLTRHDVHEELDRLTAHIDETERVLKSEERPGKRLDFLMQELNREANTLSSKSDTIQQSQCALGMKVLIEQMREQIQNIE